MRDSPSLLTLVGVFCAVIGVTLGHYHDPWAAVAQGTSEDDEMEAQPGGFSVVTGPMEDDLSESWPWAHHVDFNERFPGEDQIAEESVGAGQVDRPSRLPQWEQRRPPSDLFDDLVVPDFARMFNEGPQLGIDLLLPGNGPQLESIPQPQEPIGHYVQPWWNLFGMSPGTVWWKGSNVCIKREEEESQSDEDSSESNDGYKIQFSMCSKQDTRFVCVTRQQSPATKKMVTVRTEYECCQGYELDAQRSSCVRGGHQDILTTIEQIGGTEFARLVKMVGLESKLKTQNLTVFVPSNEALVKYLREHHLESNSIQFIPQVPQPLIRQRRNILMHAKNEPGGRNVRRRGGESKGRMTGRDETDDMYPTDISSSSEEDREQDTDDVVRIPVVKRRDPSVVSTRPEERHNGVGSQREDNNGPYYGLERNKGHLEQMLLNQMLAGKLSTDDFIDEKVLFTENMNELANEVEALETPVLDTHREPSQGSVLRLNTWFIPPQGQLFTVNCVPVTAMNNKCSNGMVHVVSNVFQPATQSIAELLANNPQLSLFRSYLETAGLLSMLEKSDGHLTLLAPTNEALESIEPSVLTRMRNGDSCLKKILRRHILPITFCSSVISTEGQARNIDLELLNIVRDNSDKMFINGSEIIKKDSIATNGVVHVVNKVIISENDKKLSEILQQEGFSTFLAMMSRVGVNLDEMENVTVFAPSNDALARSISEDIITDTKRLRELLMFHVARPETSRCSLKEKDVLPSIIPGRSLHIKPMTLPLWPLIPSFEMGRTTVECAKIGEKSGRGCNGVYHEIERVMVPPVSSVFAVIQELPKFSIFAELMMRTLDRPMVELLTSGNETLTVFAPTDKAFNGINRSELQRLRSDKQYALRVLSRHKFRDAVCCSEAYPPHNIFFKMMITLEGSIAPSPISRNYDGSVQFGKGKVTSCDLMSLNGVVHTVDTVSVDETPTSSLRRTHQPQLQYFNFGR